MQIEQNVSVAPLTTLGVGGRARFFARATSAREVEEVITFARSSRLPLFVLGGGSNVVVSDRGWGGMVLQVGILGMAEEQSRQEARFRVGAGEDWDSFVAHAVTRNCAGVECLSGIPGSVGGTPVQNVGAYGQEVRETISSVLVFDLRENLVRELSPQECLFAYRTSLFNTVGRDRFVILQVTYRLRPNGRPKLDYTDLRAYFAEHDAVPTLAETRDAVREIRRRKGMLITPGDPDSRSAGSFFKNPVIAREKYLELAERAAQRGLDIPSYPALSEQKKISAAWLVEHSGFSKGFRKGRAGISTKHALAIVNLGGATASEIMALQDDIRSRVDDVWGIGLETEPVLLGFE